MPTTLPARSRNRVEVSALRPRDAADGRQLLAIFGFLGGGLFLQFACALAFQYPDSAVLLAALAG